MCVVEIVAIVVIEAAVVIVIHEMYKAKLIITTIY